MADRRFFNPSVPLDPNQSIGMLMGVWVPVNVRLVNVWGIENKVVWRNRDGSLHEMEWPTDGDVTPIIVAMRMSC